MLEVHYENKDRIQGLTDTTGFKVHRALFKTASAVTMETALYLRDIVET